MSVGSGGSLTAAPSVWRVNSNFTLPQEMLEEIAAVSVSSTRKGMPP